MGFGFVLAGIGIACGETAQTAAVAGIASPELRGSAFGLLAALVVSRTSPPAPPGSSGPPPNAAFLFAAAMLLALIALTPTATASQP